MTSQHWPGLHSIAERESGLLAPIAMHSADCSGREHPEPEHPYRGPFQRDRDRVLHSAAYRRLSDKTQVFTGEGDYHRTRLTHTLEVTSIARTIGRALRLNEDLIEALAMLHDIGHPPFGHAGEDALDECLADDGGFSHNRYALTIVRELEARYQAFPGLNLTFEVLNGQGTRVNKRDTSHRPLLESRVVDLADSITYDAHDTDDAVQLGLITMDELMEIPLIQQTVERVRDHTGKVSGDMLRIAVVHELIDWQVSEVLNFTSETLAKNEFENAEQARQANVKIGPSPTMAKRKRELENFLDDHVYRHPRLVSVRCKAQVQLREMFHGFVARPEMLPDKFRDRAGVVGLKRAVGDYLAGMTDRYCQHQYQRYFTTNNGG